MTTPADGRCALICPGQGAQKPGAVADLDPAARPLFDRASALIGLDLWEAGRDLPADALAMPSIVQPLLVAWAVAEVERAGAERPDLPSIDYYLGHSSGQNSAAALCGALPFADAVRFAHERGHLLDRDCRATPNGLVALAGVDRDSAIMLARDTGAEIANHNAADQVVLGGSRAAVEAVTAEAARRGLRAVPLRVAGAFHTQLFRTADALAEPLIAALPIRQPFTPMIGNRSGQLIADPAALRDELRGQFSRPLEWVTALQCAYAQGVRTFVVAGPGNAMAGLLRRFALTVPDPLTLTLIRLSRSAARE